MYKLFLIQAIFLFFWWSPVAAQKALPQESLQILDTLNLSSTPINPLDSLGLTNKLKSDSADSLIRNTQTLKALYRTDSLDLPKIIEKLPVDDSVLSSFSEYEKKIRGLEKMADLDHLNTSVPDPQSDIMSQENLGAIQSSFLKSREVRMFDSLRREAVKLKGLEERQQSINGYTKRISYIPKPNFWDRSYFDGIIGVVQMPNESVQLVNISPTWGHYLNSRLSVGIGLNVLINAAAREHNSTLGGRSFIKYEPVQRKIYLQVETMSHMQQPKPEGISNRVINHGVGIGGGYLLKISDTGSLNLMVLYNLLELQDTNASPFNFRVGFSGHKPDPSKGKKLNRTF